MPEWTVEDLPAHVWRAILAASLAAGTSRRVVELTLELVHDLAVEFRHHEHRLTPEFNEKVQLHLDAFKIRANGTGRPRNEYWLVYEVQVHCAESAFAECAAQALPAWGPCVMRLWSGMGGNGPAPAHLVDEIQTKRSQFARAVEFVAELRGLERSTLRQAVLAIRRRQKALRAR